MSSTSSTRKPSGAPAASRLGSRIREFDIMGTLQRPKLMPEFLASDVAGFLLHVVLATDWSSFWKAKLFQAIPVSKTISDNITGFWGSFWQERWHSEDVLEERAKKWNPHLYKAQPPRLRSYREILNRQQALINCCGAQLHGLDTQDVLRNMLQQAALAFCWMWTLFKDHVAVVWLLSEFENKSEGYRQTIEDSVPPVVRKGECILSAAKDDQSRRCLGRIQQRINRGQDLINRFIELELCQVDEDEGAWDEMDWLLEKDGEIPAEMPDEDRFLLNRVVFSAGLSWFMVSISCDFATFYLFVLALRLKSRFLG
ncbi:dimethylaniline monooxygenase [Colletotrichum truncatum]|uniref:Dimethylaniline monooxygenase n=1 Tax=Colletotrichum truncatum TaxID=5467 RepID=A0ACC3Z5W7_COLTU|nr:dimethylaniline monooxygenase [Colletotrichum truncatum]KAF6787220.1 dimethylaniline monooxygenase [Colletotrichum truncatum]